MYKTGLSRHLNFWQPGTLTTVGFKGLRSVRSGLQEWGGGWVSLPAACSKKQRIYYNIQAISSLWLRRGRYGRVLATQTGDVSVSSPRRSQLDAIQLAKTTVLSLYPYFRRTVTMSSCICTVLCALTSTIVRRSHLLCRTPYRHDANYVWNWQSERSHFDSIRSNSCVNQDGAVMSYCVGMSGCRTLTVRLICYRCAHRSKKTRKSSYRWQTRATRKPAKKLLQFDVLTTLSLTILAYIFMRLAAVASEICEIPRNSLKIQTCEVQGHPRSSILVPIESPYVTCY